MPPWSLIAEMLQKLIIPASAATGAFLLVWCLVLKRKPAWWSLGGVVAVLLGLAAGNHYRELLEWWPAGVPREGMATPLLAKNWPALLPVTAASLLVALVGQYVSTKLYPPVLFALRLVVAGIAAWWLAEELPPLSLGVSRGLWFLGIFSTWEALLAAAPKLPRSVALPALVLPWGTAVSLVLIFAHSARFSDLGLLLTCTLGAASAVGYFYPQSHPCLYAAAAVFFPSLTLAGAANTFSEISLITFLLTALAPNFLWLGILVSRNRAQHTLLIAMLAASCIPNAVSLVTAAWKEDLAVEE